MRTDRAATTSPPQHLTRARAHQIAAFYTQHATSLERAITRQLHAPRPEIEDICQTAWTILLRRDDIPLDHQGLLWLRKVALTTGWRTARRREQPVGCFLPEHEEPGELPEPPAAAPQLDERITDRLYHRAQLQTLTARERRYLALQAIGLSYTEIAAHEHTTTRTVERQVLRAKGKLRDLTS